MKVAVDTNVLVRAVVGDDVAQARVAAKVLTDAKLVAVALPCLCEFVWVLRKVYGLRTSRGVRSPILHRRPVKHYIFNSYSRPYQPGGQVSHLASTASQTLHIQ